jgi:hypothetical protein
MEDQLVQECLEHLEFIFSKPRISATYHSEYYDSLESTIKKLKEYKINARERLLCSIQSEMAEKGILLNIRKTK